jgi:hypothetical protein
MIDLDENTTMAALVEALRELQKLKRNILDSYAEAAKLDTEYLKIDEQECKVRYYIAVKAGR